MIWKPQKKKLIIQIHQLNNEYKFILAKQIRIAHARVKADNYKTLEK